MYKSTARRVAQVILARYRNDPGAILGDTLMAAILAGVCTLAALFPRQALAFLSY
jgi:hypothetical protein